MTESKTKQQQKLTEGLKTFVKTLLNIPGEPSKSFKSTTMCLQENNLPTYLAQSSDKTVS